jgi:chromosomal replication initiation ATPase DnaA
MTANYYIIPGIKKEVTFYEVVLVVSGYTGVDGSEILGKDRHRPVAFARSLVVYFAKNRAKLTYNKIGKYLRNADHTSAMSSYNKIKGFLDINDPQTCKAVEEIEMLIR